MEVKSYLVCEMRILPSVVERLNIVRIFPPAKEDWNIFYVEFESEQEVDTIINHTRYMTKKDHRLIRWIPKQMYDRYRAIQRIAYTITKEEGLKTRVKIGNSDFLLTTRDPNSSFWCTRNLPSNLPDITFNNMNMTPASPPPGRPQYPVLATSSSSDRLDISKGIQLFKFLPILLQSDLQNSIKTMGVSIQQWRNAIGCYSSNSSKNVSQSVSSSDSLNLSRQSLPTIVILTVLLCSSTIYLSSTLPRILPALQSEPSSVPSFILLNHLPPWPPDTSSKVSSNSPVQSALTAPLVSKQFSPAFSFCQWT